jgi:hypothetical protein
MELITQANLEIFFLFHILTYRIKAGYVEKLSNYH